VRHFLQAQKRYHDLHGGGQERPAVKERWRLSPGGCAVPERLTDAQIAAKHAPLRNGRWSARGRTRAVCNERSESHRMIAAAQCAAPIAPYDIPVSVGAHLRATGTTGWSRVIGRAQVRSYDAGRA
jgi:hypothetical protein